MTRYAIDAGVAVRLVEQDASVPARHQLVGPNLLRSQSLAALYRSVRAGERSQREGLVLLDRLATMRIRLLGDRVSRQTAWRIAAELGWDDPSPAEYLAVATLQADALVTADPLLVHGAQGRVEVVDAAVLLR